MRKFYDEFLKISKLKKSIIILPTLLLFLIIIGVSYSYFSAQVTGGTGANINAQTGTTDSLMFESVQDIDLRVEVRDFGIGGNNLTKEAIASANLRANNTTNYARGKYNVFFIIDDNEFIYTTEEGLPELVINVIDPLGNEITDIPNLKKVENGFDITNRTGGYLISADYEIETTSTETQEWKVEVTLNNLNTNQNVNLGKSLNGRLFLTTNQVPLYEIPEINSIETTSTHDSITANLKFLEGTSKIDKYYFAIEEDTSGLAMNKSNSQVKMLANYEEKNLDFFETDEPTYTFTNLKPNTNYKVYSYAKDKQGINSNIYEANITTDEYILPKVTYLNYNVTLNSITLTVTSEKGSNGVVNYYFSKDDGATWSEPQTSNIYTFTNLLDTTDYKIKVKVEDTDGKFSTDYTKTIATLTYINPSITKVESSKSYNSINLTTIAEKGTNEISKYYYSKDDGATWNEGTSTYKFVGLDENKTYKIKVKVEDIEGRESTPYSFDVITDTYKIPTVSAKISTITSNSIKINSTGKNGDGTIAKYIYSKDGGSNWTTIDNTDLTDTYIFEKLTPGATYQIKVKVIDSNNRESDIISIPNISTLNVFINNSINYVGGYNGNAQSFTPSLSTSATSIYYSTSIKLDVNNYKTSGTRTQPTRTDLGTTTVYWCAEKEGYETYCGENTITINKGTPTFTVASTASISSTSNTSSITVDRSGDGSLSCESASTGTTTGTYAKCSVSGTTITFTRNGTNTGTENFTIKLAEGTKYNAGANKTVTLTVNNQNFTNSSSNYSGTYDGNSKTVTISLKDVTGSIVTPTTMYYSTSTELTPSNYSSGDTTKPTRTNAGIDTVYWCAVKSGFNTYCSENTITINKATPTFSLSSTTSAIGSTANASSITVTRSGDGSLSCVSASTGTSTGSKAICSVSGTTVTFTRNGTNTGSENFTISLAAGTNYNAGTNKTVTLTVNNQNFTNSSSNISGTYNGSSKTITVSLKDVTGATVSPTSIYYSTSTQLTTSNYSSNGSTTKPTRTDAGVTTVYWCAVKSGFNTLCSSNTIAISKASPTFSLSSTSSTISATANTSSITVTRSGDGSLSCESASTGTTTGTYAKCSVSGTTVTFTRVAAGTENFTIKLAAGTNYNAGSDKTVSVTVNKLNFTNNSSNVTGTYNGSDYTFTPSLSPSATSIYYSTSTELTTSNYTSSGSTSGTHSRTNAGTTTVYWCAVKAGYNTLCSKNTLTVNKATPTFTVSSDYVTIDTSSTTTTISYSYDGDGTVSCEPSSSCIIFPDGPWVCPSNDTYASCGVDTSTKKITFTRKSATSSGSQPFKINIESGTNYNGTSKSIGVQVKANLLKKVNYEYTGEMWGHRNDITKIVLENSLVSHSNATYTYDISASQTGEVKAYLVSTGTDEYTAYIQADGNIKANPDSSELFAEFTNLISIEGLDKLDTSNVTSMYAMFANCSSLTSLNLSSFNTSKVTDMSQMFAQCSSLTTLNLSSFDTSNVTDISWMFGFGGNNVMKLTSITFGSKWNTSKVTDMSYLFWNCRNLTTLDISMFDTSQVTSMNAMFGAYGVELMSLTSIKFGDKFNTSKVTGMNSMFRGCSKLTSLDLSKFDTRNVTTMQAMFLNCSGLTTLNLSSFDTSNVTNMSGMFNKSSSLTSITFGSGFNTSKVTDMSDMFWFCTSLKTLDLSNWDTSQVTNMQGMFGANGTTMALTSITFGSNWDTSKVTNMSYMFQRCGNLTSLDLSKFNTSKVTNMSYMFNVCSSLTTLNISNFDTSQVTDMSYMFQSTNKLTTLNIKNFNISNVTTYENMFRYTYNGIRVTVKDSTVQTFIRSRLSEASKSGTVVIG